MVSCVGKEGGRYEKKAGKQTGYHQRVSQIYYLTLIRLNYDTLLLTTIQSDNRVDHFRRLRQTELQETEKKIVQTYIDEQQRTKKIAEDLQKEEELVREMQLYHQSQVRDQKLRQSIRENSIELRDLEKKLNHAYMNKERSLQLKEKELLMEKAKAKDALLDAKFKAQAEKEELEELEHQKKNQERSVEYHEALHAQLEENEQKKREDYERFLKEKEMVDNIVKKILLENEREAKLRLDKQHETKLFIENFMKEREEWKAEEKRLQEEENQKILEFAKLQKEREDKAVTKKKTLEAGKDAIYDKLAAEIENQERLKSELENLRIDLAQEEQEALARKKEHEVLQNRIRKRLETIDAYQAQVADKKLRLQQERRDEEIFREKKFAEDDRIEQMKQSVRRMKQLEHRKAVDALVEERRRLAKVEDDERKRLENIEIEIARYKAEVIEQERQRLLREHASKLAGFLPKVIKQ
ncbi:mannosyl-oligosaccharide alpha-1,2-mannosidase [Globomyces sp. JEL0801]|nr:mannosyl-oligosaccharide alpha-1,2-mannosidase [Globomyces sp. JEL0801]